MKRLYSNMGKVLKKLRLKHDISQKDVAKFLKMGNFQQISDVENGKEMLPIKHHRRLAKGFEVPIAKFRVAHLADLKIKYNNEV